MKKVNFLSNLWSLLVSSRSSDVRVTSDGASDEHPMSIRSASDGTSRRHAGSLWRACAVIAILLTIGVENVLGATVTIDKDDTWAHTGTSGSGSQTDIVKSGITVSTGKGYVDAGNHIRVYSGGEISVSSTVGNITKLEFTSTASGTSSNGPSKISLKSGQDGSYSYSSYVGTWTRAGATTGRSSVIFSATAQFRFTQVVVYYAAATVSKTSITGLDYNYGSGPSAAQSFTVSASDVTGTLTVTAPTNFEVSKSSGSGYGSSVTLTPTSGSVSSTTIYVRLATGKAIGSYGSASTYVTVTGGGILTKNISVSGTVSAAASYTVTYNGNGNTGGSVPTDATAYSSGATVTVKTNSGSLAKTGWTFAGWNTNATGTGTDRAAGSTFSISASTTLYAKWTRTVKWSVNGNDNYSSSTVTYNATSSKVGSVPTAPNPASYCGDKFVGWTTDENYVHGTSTLFTTAGDSPNLNSITTAVTFYAVFADYDE